MKRYPVLIGIAAFAVLATISAGVFLYLRPEIFGKPKLPPAPYGGITRAYDSRMAIIDDIKLESLPDKESFLKAFAAFLTARSMELSGSFAPPGMLPLPFRARIGQDAMPGFRTVEFRARDNDRELAFDGRYDLTTQTLSAEIRGNLSSQEFRALKIPMDQLHGSVRFQGDIELQSIPDTPIQMDLRGRFAQESWLELGMFRLSAPGAFQCEVKKDGSWQLQLPDAKFAFSSLLFSGLDFQSTSKTTMRFASLLNLELPYQLSAPLPVTGSIDSVTGTWQFNATAGDMLFLSTSQSQTRLNRFSLGGNGDEKGGKFIFDAAGESFSLRPDRNAPILWNGVDVQFSGWRELQFPAPGKVEAGKDELNLKFRSFELSGSGRRLYITAPELTVTGSGKPDALHQVAMRAERIASRHAEESLTLEQPNGSASILVDDGEIIILENLAASARSFAFQDGESRCTANKPVITGTFDRLSQKAAPNLRFQVQGDSAQWHTSAIAGKAQHALWQLSAEFPRGVRRPPAWTHNFAARNGEVRRGSLSGSFAEAGLELELADSDLSIRSAALRFSKLTGIYNQRKASEKWRFSLAECSGNIARQLDGWLGKISAKGELESQDQAFKLSGIELDLPLSPASAPTPANGSLTVKKITTPDNMVDSLKAELTAQGTNLRWRGTTSSALLSGGGFFFTGTLKQENGMYDLFSEYHLPLTRLNAPIQPGKLLPLSPEWRFTGKLGASGTLGIGENQLYHTVAYELDGDATLPPWSITGVSGTIAIGKSSEIAFRKITPGIGDLSDGRLQLLLTPNIDTLQQAEFIFAGGMAKLARETRFSADKPPILELEVKGVLPTQLLKLPPGCELGGHYSGTVRGSWGAQGFELHSAQLRSGAGNLALAPLEQFRYIPATGANPELFEFAASALKHFKAQKTELRMHRSANGLDLRIKAEGTPANTLPFVYDNGAFRAQREGEYGFTGDVTISSDYRIQEERP